MISLREGFFKPMLILLSIIFLPTSCASWILTLSNFRIAPLIVSLVFSLSFFATVFGVYKYSKSDKEQLYSEEGVLVIIYPNVTTSPRTEIEVNNIVKIEYYKISSFRAWCMLYNYVCPCSAFITYLLDGKEVCKHIGYPRYDKIKTLCSDIGVKFVIK